MAVRASTNPLPAGAIDSRTAGSSPAREQRPVRERQGACELRKIWHQFFQKFWHQESPSLTV
jgi:hypothetical protein